MGRRGKDLSPFVKDSILSLPEHGYSGIKIAHLLNLNSSAVKMLKTFETSWKFQCQQAGGEMWKKTEDKWEER